MESKLIEKINQNYSTILSILKNFLKENFLKIKANSKNYNSFENDLLNTKDKQIPKFINDYSIKNDELFDKFENIKVRINELINDNIKNKNKIVEKMNESFYLIKHPQHSLLLLELEKNNDNFLNYLKLIETQINSHKYDMIESIHFILSNIKLNYS